MTHIESLIKQALEVTGVTLWGIEFPEQALSLTERRGASKNKTLRIYIERANRPVTIADCAKAMRQLRVALATRPGVLDYTLEVSSPGVKKPLLNSSHLQLAVEGLVEVCLKATPSGHLKGKLKYVHANEVAIEESEGLLRVLPKSDIKSIFLLTQQSAEEKS